MKPQDDGGPAYPRPVSECPNGAFAWDQTGMSLRDAFAMAALEGIIVAQAGDSHFKGFIEHIASLSYAVADAMLVERQKFYATPTPPTN